jgi:glycosyltransferase involved in cell wall biosynthesis
LAPAEEHVDLNQAGIRVSVVIPAYNAENHLRRAVTSALRQSYRPAEVLVIDDGSTDATGEAARRFGRDVRYIHQANAGPASARNRGVSESTCDWIAFLDADDEWLPHKLQQQVACLVSVSELVWCNCSPVRVHAPEVSTSELPDDLVDILKTQRHLPFFKGASLGLALQTSGFVIQRRVIEEVGGINPYLTTAEDRDLWWRIAFRHPRIGYCGEAGYRFFCDSPDSLTKQLRGRSVALRVVCENVRRARAIGGESAHAFEPYARKLAMDYVLRAVGSQTEIEPDVICEALRLFPPPTRRRLLLLVMAALPRRVARRIVEHTRL